MTCTVTIAGSRRVYAYLSVEAESPEAALAEVETRLENGTLEASYDSTEDGWTWDSVLDAEPAG